MLPIRAAGEGDIRHALEEGQIQNRVVDELRDDQGRDDPRAPSAMPDGDDAFHREERPEQHPEREPHPGVHGNQHDEHQREVAEQGNHPVTDADLLRPVARGLRAHPVGAQVLQRTALPAQALGPEHLPAGHQLGDDRAALRRGGQRAEGLQRNGQLIVLGQRGGVIDFARVARQRGAAGRGHCAQGRGAEDRGGAGEHEDPAIAALDLALVAGVFVALELAEQPMSLFAVEETAHRHQRAVPGEPVLGGFQESGADLRIRIHHHDAVVIAHRRQNGLQRLVQRPALLVLVLHRFEDLDTVLARHLNGGIGAIVGHHDDPRRPEALLLEGLERKGQGSFLVVRRNQHRHGDFACVDTAGASHHGFRRQRSARFLYWRPAIAPGDKALSQDH